MPAPPALHRALDAVHHLRDAEVPWQDILEGATALIGGDSATFILMGSDNQLLTLEQRGVDGRAERDYVERFAAMDILAPAGAAAAAGSWLDTGQLFGAHALERHPYYVDFMCPHRMRQMVCFVAVAGPDRHGGLTVQRGRARAPLGEGGATGAAQAAVRRFTDALRQGLAERDAQARRWFDAAGDAFGAYGEAVCLLGREGLLLQASDTAAALLAIGRGGLVLRGGRLWHASPRLQDALRHGVRAVLEERRAVSLALRDLAGTQLSLDLAPAAPALWAGSQRAALARLRPVATPGGASAVAGGTWTPEALRAAFPITLAEARLLAGLVAGLSPKQYAARAGISVHTVRSQIASLMVKMNCRRQLDLVRMALHGG